MNYTMHLHNRPFDAIQSGNKKIEVRLNDPKRQVLKTGDKIKFIKLSDKKVYVETKIVDLLKLKSFKSLLDNYSMDNFGLDKNYSKEKYIKDTYKIYTKENEKKFGVLGIVIELV